MSKSVKIEIFKTMAKPDVVCGSGTPAITEICMKRLSIWERKILRRMYGPVAEKGMWKIRANQELKRSS
jgi:hypothetical protein